MYVKRKNLFKQLLALIVYIILHEHTIVLFILVNLFVSIDYPTHFQDVRYSFIYWLNFKEENVHFVRNT